MLGKHKFFLVYYLKDFKNSAVTSVLTNSSLHMCICKFICVCFFVFVHFYLYLCIFVFVFVYLYLYIWPAPCKKRSQLRQSSVIYKKVQLWQSSDQSDGADKELWLSRVHQAQPAQLERKARPWCNLLLREPLFVRQPSQQVGSLRLRPPHLIGLELQKPRNSLKLPKSR